MPAGEIPLGLVCGNCMQLYGWDESPEALAQALRIGVRMVSDERSS